jgi:hypothetical protein
LKRTLVFGFLLTIFLAGSLGAAQQVVRAFKVGGQPRLIIDVEPAHLVVEPGEDSLIILDARLPRADLYELEFDQQGDEIEVKLASESALGYMMRQMRLYTGDEVNIRVRVPENCHVSFQTRSGRIEINGVDEEVRFHSGSSVTRAIGWMFRLSTETEGSD